MAWDGEDRRADGRRANDLTDHELDKLRGVMHNFVHLTPEEIKAMRDIIEADARAKWLWAGVRNIAVWVVAVIGGLTLAYESITTAIKKIAGS